MWGRKLISTDNMYRFTCHTRGWDSVTALASSRASPWMYFLHMAQATVRTWLMCTWWSFVYVWCLEVVIEKLQQNSLTPIGACDQTAKKSQPVSALIGGCSRWLGFRNHPDVPIMYRMTLASCEKVQILSLSLLFENLSASAKGRKKELKLDSMVSSLCQNAHLAVCCPSSSILHILSVAFTDTFPAACGRKWNACSWKQRRKASALELCHDWQALYCIEWVRSRESESQTPAIALRIKLRKWDSLILWELNFGLRISTSINALNHSTIETNASNLHAQLHFDDFFS